MPGVRLVAFSGRPDTPPVAGGAGISRFPCEEFPRMLRVSDCAGPEAGSPVPPVPVWPSPSLNRVGTPDCLISQLDGWPACAPINASAEALRPLPHDSGSGWLAGPSPYDSCIRYSLPVSRRTTRPADHVEGMARAKAISPRTTEDQRADAVAVFFG